MKIEMQKPGPAAVTWLWRITLVVLYVVFFVFKKKLYL
jgi:hypothetical protein